MSAPHSDAVKSQEPFYFSQEFGEAAELESWMPGKDLRVIQTGPASGRSRWTTAEISDFRFSHLVQRVPWLAETITLRAHYSLFMPVPDAAEVLYGREPMPLGKIALYGSGSEHRSFVTDGGEWFCLTVPEECMRRAVDSLVRTDAPYLTGRELVLSADAISQAILADFHHLASMLLAGDPDVFKSAEALGSLRESLLEVMSSVFGLIRGPQCSSAGALRRKARQLVMNRAKDYLAANADRTIVLRELCEAAGASKRHLQDLFLQELGMTPMRYLRNLRLKRVRRQLLDEGCSVKSAALGNGFWDLSRFARNYRQVYGELPSETLRHVHPEVFAQGRSPRFLTSV